MNFIKEKERIYLADDNKNVIAEIEFKEVDNDVYEIFHTYVDDSLRGQGIASLLVKEAVDEIKSRNGKVTASCSYAKKWLEKNSII